MPLLKLLEIWLNSVILKVESLVVNDVLFVTMLYCELNLRIRSSPIVPCLRSKKWSLYCLLQIVIWTHVINKSGFALIFGNLMWTLARTVVPRFVGQNVNQPRPVESNKMRKMCSHSNAYLSYLLISITMISEEINLSLWK